MNLPGYLYYDLTIIINLLIPHYKFPPKNQTFVLSNSFPASLENFKFVFSSAGDAKSAI